MMAGGYVMAWESPSVGTPTFSLSIVLMEEENKGQIKFTLMHEEFWVNTVSDLMHRVIDQYTDKLHNQ